MIMQDQYTPELDDDEVEIEAIGIEVDSQPIELYKVLKIANVVSGGGEAKYAIAEGYVAVNGEIEYRKRRKVLDGDLIEFNGEYYLIICDQPVDHTPRVKAEKLGHTHKTAKQKKADKNQAKASVKDERDPKKSEISAKKDKSKATIEPSNDGGRSRIHFG
jgi:ribosome-associated protein